MSKDLQESKMTHYTMKTVTFEGKSMMIWAYINMMVQKTGFELTAA